MPSGTENCRRAPSEVSGDLMDVPEDAPVVRDDALERLLELLLPVLLVELHEDLLQARSMLTSEFWTERGVTYKVKPVEPLLDLQPVGPLRALVRRV